MHNEYKMISEFCCFGKEMVIVKTKSRAVCVMLKLEYDQIIESKRRFEQRNKLRRSA